MSRTREEPASTPRDPAADRSADRPSRPGGGPVAEPRMPSDASTRRLISLAASAFVVLAAEPLYLLVDTAVVGHLGSVQLGGLGVAGALMTLLTVVGTFVEYGTTSRSARWFGAGRLREAVDEGVQASWLAAAIGAGIVL